MTIIEALKKQDLRISANNKWLYWDEATDEWVVMVHHYKRKGVIELIRTKYEAEAVEILIEEN